MGTQENPREPLSEEDGLFVDIWGGKIGLQIVSGNRESAHQLVDKAFATRQAARTPHILSVPLAEIGIDQRTCNALERHANIGTVGEVLQSDIATLLGIPNVGVNMVLSLLQNLAAQSIKRTMELENELENSGGRHGSQDHQRRS